MIFGSVCSGIEAASVAWHPLGWRAAFVSEIEKFPCAVLAHHYPSTPNHGDMTRFEEWPDAAIDVLVGGTPCQSFSVAGLRKGLADPRGNLMLTYGAIAQRYRPRWLVWENVPGVLSSGSRGGDFGTFLGMLGELGYGFAYRVLDAQYFGVPQRRRRVFVVGCLGDWRRAAAVLSERASMRGDPAPSREAREGIAVGALAGTSPGGGWRIGPDEAAAGHVVPAWSANVAPTLTADYGDKMGLNNQHVFNQRGGCFVPIAFAENSRAEIRMEGGDGSRTGALSAGGGKAGQGVPMIAHAFDARQSDVIQYGDKTGPLDTDGHTIAVAIDCYNGAIDGECTASLRAGNGNELGGVPSAMSPAGVRRLTPRECERLQGFPDDYTLIPEKNGKSSADGPRYKALGNSMAVPVMSWLGRRIQMVNALGVFSDAA